MPPGKFLKIGAVRFYLEQLLCDMVDKLFSVKTLLNIAMMTHHVAHESFKNNISNNTHNIAQGGHPVSKGANAP